MREVMLLVVGFLLGCGSEHTATQDDTDSSNGTESSSGTPATSAGPVSTSGGSQTSDPSDTGDGSGTTNPTDPTSGGSATSVGTDTSATTGAPSVPGSCKALLEEDPSTPTGVHVLSVGGDPNGATFSAYCDMQTAGGGWTLAGRSVPGVDKKLLVFGYFSQTGSVDDDSQPYSLDVAAHEIEFTEVLVGLYATGKAWGDYAYMLEVPENFLWLYRDAPYYAGAATTVIGDCEPEDGPRHLRWTGWTELDDVFMFSDYQLETHEGLGANEFYTYSDSCDSGANLNTQPGMIFVR